MDATTTVGCVRLQFIGTTAHRAGPILTGCRPTEPASRHARLETKTELPVASLRPRGGIDPAAISTAREGGPAS